MLSWRSCWQGGDGVRNRPTRGCLSLPRSQLGCTALYSLPFLPPLILVCPQQFEQFELFLPSLPCRVLHPMPAVMVQPDHAPQEFFFAKLLDSALIPVFVSSSSPSGWATNMEQWGMAKGQGRHDPSPITLLASQSTTHADTHDTHDTHTSSCPNVQNSIFIIHPLHPWVMTPYIQVSTFSTIF